MLRDAQWHAELLNREDLIHERAVRAVQAHVLLAPGPVVRLRRHGFDDYRDFPNVTRGLVARGYTDDVDVIPRPDSENLARLARAQVIRSRAELFNINPS
jgi:hypothetical protein